MLLNLITPYGYLQKIHAVGLFFKFFTIASAPASAVSYAKVEDFCGQKEEWW